LEAGFNYAELGVLPKPVSAYRWQFRASGVADRLGRGPIGSQQERRRPGSGDVVDIEVLSGV